MEEVVRQKWAEELRSGVSELMGSVKSSSYMTCVYNIVDGEMSL